jgi:hypothetical protein
MGKLLRIILQMTVILNLTLAKLFNNIVAERTLQKVTGKPKFRNGYLNVTCPVSAICSSIYYYLFLLSTFMISNLVYVSLLIKTAM